MDQKRQIIGFLKRAVHKFPSVPVGHYFKLCSQYTLHLGDAEDRALKADDTRNRAWAFLLRLLEETEKRLPPNMAVFKQMTFFSPIHILGPKPPKFSEMPFIECILGHEDLSELEEQWRQVTQVTILLQIPAIFLKVLMFYPGCVNLQIRIWEAIKV